MNKLLNKLVDFWFFLDGKKTYIVATVTTVVNVLLVVDPTLLSPGALLKLDAVLVALGGAALRHGMNKE
jgi:hypothetical protein